MCTGTRPVAVQKALETTLLAPFGLAEVTSGSCTTNIHFADGGGFRRSCLHRKADLQNITRIPRFGESIDHQKSENGRLVPRF